MSSSSIPAKSETKYQFFNAGTANTTGTNKIRQSLQLLSPPRIRTNQLHKQFSHRLKPEHTLHRHSLNELKTHIS